MKAAKKAGVQPAKKKAGLGGGAKAKKTASNTSASSNMDVREMLRRTSGETPAMTTKRPRLAVPGSVSLDLGGQDVAASSVPAPDTRHMAIDTPATPLFGHVSLPPPPYTLNPKSRRIVCFFE